MNDTIDIVTVKYYAIHRDTGRRCAASLVSLMTPGVPEQWVRDGWDIETVAETEAVPVFGNFKCKQGTDAELARVKMELEQMRIDRDNWRASATIASER